MQEGLAQVKRFHYLDSARGLAALSVVTWHFINAFADAKGMGGFVGTPLHFFWYGEADVIFFFVHSGFILSYSYADAGKPLGVRSYGRFLIERIFRIYPLFLFVLWLSFLLKTFVFPLGTGQFTSVRLQESFWSRPDNLRSMLKESALIFSLVQDGSALVPQEWTLAVEVVVGPLVPILAFLLRKRVWSWVYWVLVLLLIRLAGLNTFVFEFALGVFIFYRWESIRNAWMGFERWKKLLMGGVAILLYTCIFHFSILFNFDRVFIRPGVDRFIVAMGCGLFFCIMISSAGVQRIMSAPLLVKIGKACYSLYLLHMLFLICFADYLMGLLRKELPAPYWVSMAIFFAGYLVINVGLSFVTFRLIERPFNLVGKRVSRWVWGEGWRRILVFGLFCGGAWLLYFRMIGRSFASDDFEVIRRVATTRKFLAPGFFRPLSDITIYLNYCIGGYAPAVYYAFNILIHAGSAYLVYAICRRWKWTLAEAVQERFAIIAGLLFLTYPFHNEGIAWLLGRGASMATLFALSGMLVAMSGPLTPGRVISACLLYFAGMMAYETIVFLPVLAPVMLYDRNRGKRSVMIWAGALFLTLGLNIGVRAMLPGGVTGGYGGDFFHQPWGQYAGNFLKVAGRLFLPPSDRTGRMLVCSVIVAGVLLSCIILFFKKYRGQWAMRGYFLKIVFCIGTASIIPVLSAVSTRTSESDRLLYFPSVFVCIGIAFMLVSLYSKEKGQRLLYAAVALLLAVNIYFLEMNNRNWLKASGITRAVIAGAMKTAAAAGRGKVYIVNLPDEQDGAYIFRHGFKDALLMAGADTGRYVVVNRLGRDACLSLPDTIRPAMHAGELLIQPLARVRAGVDSRHYTIEGTGDVSIRAGEDSVRMIQWDMGPEDRLLWWNRQELTQWVTRMGMR